MDIKEQIAKIVDEVKSNPSLMKEFEKDPVKAIEKLTGIDLPDDLVEKVIDGVKAKLAVDKVSDVAGAIKNLF